MRKYLKITIGLFRLLKEWIINLGKCKIHGIQYCICSGVKIWTHDGGICDLGIKTWISENTIFEAAGGIIKLGENNFFNTNCRIVSMEYVEIGNDNLFGPNVIIIDHNHRYHNCNVKICKQGFDVSPIHIGSDIWVGGNTCILSGIEICDHVVIGANSIVTRNITEPGVYVGCPVRKIK